MKLNTSIICSLIALFISINASSQSIAIEQKGNLYKYTFNGDLLNVKTLGATVKKISSPLKPVARVNRPMISLVYLQQLVAD